MSENKYIQGDGNWELYIYKSMQKILLFLRRATKFKPINKFSSMCFFFGVLVFYFHFTSP